MNLLTILLSVSFAISTANASGMNREGAGTSKGHELGPQGGDHVTQRSGSSAKGTKDRDA